MNLNRLFLALCSVVFTGMFLFMIVGCIATRDAGGMVNCVVIVKHYVGDNCLITFNFMNLLID